MGWPSTPRPPDFATHCRGSPRGVAWANRPLPVALPFSCLHCHLPALMSTSVRGWPSPLRPTSVLACLWHLQAGPPQGSGSIGSPVQRADLRPRALQPVQISTGVLGDEVCRGPTPELLLQHSAGRRLIITERRKGEERGERWTRGLSPPRPPRSSSKVLPKSLQPLRTSLPSSLVLSRLPLASGPGCDVGQVQCEVRVSQNQPFRRSPL